MIERIRLAELLGTLSFAGDLGRGQPMGHVLRTTRIAMVLAERMGLASGDLADVYFTGLLVHAGCTAGTAEFAAFLAGDELSAQKDLCLCDPNSLGQVLGWMRRNVAPGQALPARTLRMLQLIARGDNAFPDLEQGCSEVGSRIAARLGLGPGTQQSLYTICERWNGKGPHRLKGADIPLPGRVVNAAMILEVFAAERGAGPAREAALARRGKSFDPEVADAAAALCEDAVFWRSLAGEEAWDAVLALEPAPHRFVDERGLDAFLETMGDIVDLKSATIAAHSHRTAALTSALAERMKLPPTEATLARRAALVHDVGLVAVPARLLTPGVPWSEADAERYRLHTHYTERILARSPCLAAIAPVAAAHHENIDGSGFHRGLAANQLPLASRLVAAASAYVELSEGAAEPEQALALLKQRRRLDPDCLAALAAEAGAPARTAATRTWPAELTDREVEVLRHVAGGATLKQAAAALVISPHTARHHLESVYSKAGVSSRAGLTLFALEHGLL